jgi:hypothetical protein
MANQDRWRDRDDDRFRDEGDFGGFDYGRGYGGRDYRGSFGESRGDWERGRSNYGRGREFEGGYGGAEYGRGRDFGGGYGGGFESGYRGGGGSEPGYRGGGGGGFARGDFERGTSRGGGGYGSSFGSGWGPSGGFESGYRGGGNFGQSSDWDRAYGSGGYAGARGRGRDWGFGGNPDYGRWDWSRGDDYGRGDFGRGDYGRGGGSERGFWERASDEISSWFGDEEAERRRRQDHHRGRGPKSYTRSDDRIREDINDRLTDDWRVDATHVEVSVSKGEVTLSGTVDSRDAKRRAEDIAESVSGAKHVQNNLRVDQSSWSDSSVGGTSTGGSRGFGETASAAGGTGTNLSQTSGTGGRRSET